MTKLFSQEWEREAFDRADPHAQLLITANRNNQHLLTELRIIRWLLLSLLVLGVYAMLIWAPAGWWHTPFWAL